MLLIPAFLPVGALGVFIFSILTSLFTGLTVFFVRFVTKKVALSLAAITLMLALTATFISTLSLLVTSVAVLAPTELTTAWGWFMPDNADECLAAYLAAYTARWVYDTNYNLIFKKGIFGGM